MSRRAFNTGRRSAHISGAGPSWGLIGRREPMPLGLSVVPADFRTFQVFPKDLPGEP